MTQTAFAQGRRIDSGKKRGQLSSDWQTATAFSGMLNEVLKTCQHYCAAPVCGCPAFGDHQLMAELESS
jgi:hypothetical protein